MLQTLADRLRLAMAGPPKITQAALAKACGISAPSVSDWIRGRTKSIEGVYLVRAASFLRVRPLWLAEGKGPRDIDNPYRGPLTATEPGANIISTSRGRARILLEGLPDHLVDEAVHHMEWLIERDKKTTAYVGGGRQISGHA